MLVLFIFIPFIAFVLSIRNLSNKSNAIVFILFYGLFGYCQDFKLSTSDIYRIGWMFVDFNGKDLVKAYVDGALLDFYQWIMIAVTRPFTNNPKIFLSLLGIIFGFLTYLCIIPLYEYWRGKKNLSFYILIFIFLCNISLVHFTGIRFYTAALLYGVCLLNYIIKGKRKYILLSSICIFIHFGFIPVILATFLYVLVLNRFFNIKLMPWILLSSFFISFLPIKSITNSTVSSDSLENSSIQGKFSSYSAEKSDTSSDNSFYRRANSSFTKLFMEVNKIGSFLLLLSILKHLHLTNYPHFTKKLISLTVFLFSFSYLCIGAISSGERMLNVGWIFGLFLMALILSHNHNIRWTKWNRRLIFINFYSIAFMLINAPRLVTPLLWLMNVPILIYDGIDFKMPQLD